MDANVSESTNSAPTAKPLDPASVSETGTARQRYVQRLDALAGEVAAFEARNRQLNIIRGLLFFAGLILLVVGYAAGKGALPLVVPGWIAMAAFLVVITWHEYVRDAMTSIRRRRSLYRQLLARLDRRWSDLPVFELPEDVSWLDRNGRAVAKDLDLFGVGSLYQLVSLAGTAPGKLTLARWLCGPAIPEQAAARNQAVRKLASFHDQREVFYARARDVAGQTASPENFTRWAVAPAWLDGPRRWMLPLARVIAITPFVVWPLAALGAISISIAAAIQLTMIAIAIIVTVGFLGPVHEIFKSVATRRAEVENYIRLFEAADWIPADIEMLAPVRKRILNPETGAIAGLRAMGGVSTMTSLRHAPLLFLPYVVLQLTGLWDVHVLSLMERWKARYGSDVPEWFDALGQLEAILSLAALADEYPQWASPTWNQAGPQGKVAARALGHPLLKDSARVVNDAGLGPAGTLLLVTGSNMSGKSTLLRSLGLNIKLAGAGSVVCATEFELPSCEVATSIRVDDSLREGVSFYMAELKRLREVVDHAERMHASKDRMLVYLLDEILQGTNSRERQIAVSTVLDHLVHMQAIGAISTHDLELADDPAMQSVATIVHFREHIETDQAGQETMTFDYKMRSGVTPTTNAIRLLEMVGLGKR
ncbi:Endonuclease MutS2 [Rosistilla carotiformis]|uniref:Endonuclease MutS2 n=1 Tax=Rosistilla carotiformis TaxID=2528017 RepID=A0A518JXW0_9BACT|nr:MutS family DNA mismatch repair protein [Rosistilla carotiformis]QDV70378.1 Endonuclease MutS2 [Rosistilla carotiformis]